MAIINQANTSTHKTIAEYKAHSHSKSSKQANFRIPDNLLDGLQALSDDTHINKTELINLALYNLLCHKGYENKSPLNTKKIDI